MTYTEATPPSPDEPDVEETPDPTTGNPDARPSYPPPDRPDVEREPRPAPDEEDDEDE